MHTIAVPHFAEHGSSWRPTLQRLCLLYCLPARELPPHMPSLRQGHSSTHVTPFSTFHATTMPTNDATTSHSEYSACDTSDEVTSRPITRAVSGCAATVSEAVASADFAVSIASCDFSATC